MSQERVKAGLDRARREGKKLGRRPTILRLDFVSERRAAGWSWSQIAHELGVDVSAVRRAAQRHDLVENPSSKEPAL